MRVTNKLLERTSVKTAWMPCPLPSCASYRNPPKITVNLGIWFVAISRCSASRHDVVTTNQCLRCHLGSVAFFQSA